jgi:hypothetical protein
MRTTRIVCAVAQRANCRCTAGAVKWKLQLAELLNAGLGGSDKLVVDATLKKRQVS